MSHSCMEGGMPFNFTLEEINLSAFDIGKHTLACIKRERKKK